MVCNLSDGCGFGIVQSFDVNNWNSLIIYNPSLVFVTRVDIGKSVDGGRLSSNLYIGFHPSGNPELCQQVNNGMS